jgi:hypothetical protein
MEDFEPEADANGRNRAPGGIYTGGSSSKLIDYDGRKEPFRG